MYASPNILLGKERHLIRPIEVVGGVKLALPISAKRCVCLPRWQFIVSCYVISQSHMMLFHHHQLLDRGVITRVHSTEIHSACESPRVKFNPIFPGWPCFIHQRCNPLPEDIVDDQSHNRLSRDDIRNRCNGIEGVGVVLRERKSRRHLFRDWLLYARHDLREESPRIIICW